MRGGRKMLVPKWKLFRTKEPLISVLMWGVNHTVSFYRFLFETRREVLKNVQRWHYQFYSEYITI